VSEVPWCIEPRALDIIVAMLSERMAGERPSEKTIRARLALAPPTSSSSPTPASVAVLRLQGVLMHRAGLFADVSGATSCEQLGREFQAAVNDPAIRAIAIDVDSVGGSVHGVQELADQIYAARGRKPIVAVVDATAASAALWIASQADELIATPSGMLGSIGCVAVHFDYSRQSEMLGVKPTIISAGKHKADGSELTPLGDDARADLQSKCDAYHSTFLLAVARGRGVSTRTVAEDFGAGRMLLAPDAVAVGLADGLGTLDAVVRRLASGSRSAIEAVSVNNRAKTKEEDTTMSDQSDQRPPSPRRPLRRAQLDRHGNAITWTDTGVIINDLEIIHEPSRDEASREVGRRQRAYMLAGMEAHEALARVLAEIPPVYRHAYMR
jgi:signal peptide peptidase SppA